MQYFTPGGNQFLGDCMPFYDGTTFHLFYLLDEGDHQGLGGLGGHRWAHMATGDYDDIIDVCIDGRCCLINRRPTLNGDTLFLFCENGAVVFGEFTVRPLRDAA